MTRKDTIMIAVIVNACLLAILFITAVVYEEEQSSASSREEKSVINITAQVPSPSSPIASTGDEVDNVLKYYHHSAPQPIVVETSNEIYVPERLQAHYNSVEDDVVLTKEAGSPPSYTEVIVKKGDALEKIAKAHNTTVSAIKKANHLENEKLSIGQLLKVPLQGDKKASEPLHQEAKNQEIASITAVYHTVKSGDSPWKIAKQHGVNYEDILKLNGLNEDKARNLKIGEQIRVK